MYTGIIVSGSLFSICFLFRALLVHPWKFVDIRLIPDRSMPSPSLYHFHQMLEVSSILLDNAASFRRFIIYTSTSLVFVIFHWFFLAIYLEAKDMNFP